MTFLPKYNLLWTPFFLNQSSVFTIYTSYFKRSNIKILAIVIKFNLGLNYELFT